MMQLEFQCVHVVDDHAWIRAGVVQGLRQMAPSTRCEEHASVDAALTAIAPDSQDELVILDLQMPGYSGLDAVLAMRRARPQLPVLVLSGAEELGLVKGVIEAGACGFVPKSAPAQALEHALQLILQGGVYLPPTSLSVLGAEDGRVPSARPRRSVLEALTPRQRQVLLCVARGLPNKAIARQLGISGTTVKTHVTHIFDALGVRTRTQAVYVIAQEGVSLAGIDPGSADARLTQRL